MTKLLMESWIVTDSEKRLLTEVKEKLSLKTTDLRWCIEHHRCRVNGAIERFASHRVRKGDRIEIAPAERPKFVFEPQRVLYETPHYLAYDKPPGIDSPALAKLLGLQLVHRLDRDTSGVFLLAKTLVGKKMLETLFHSRSLEKRYLACVDGHLAGHGVINRPLGKVYGREGATHWGVVPKGKSAQTAWKALESKKNLTLVLCTPKTGRTHQIRVHLRHHGYPIVGDIEYGGSSKAFRPLLHALSIEVQGTVINAPIPADFVEFFPQIAHYLHFN